MYKCSLCDYKSDLKLNVIRHREKKNKCGTGEFSIIQLSEMIICEYCKKNFTTLRSLNRHLNICKIKKDNVEKELALSNEKIKELEKKLAIAEAVGKKTTIGTQNNNIHINLAPWNNPALPENVEKYYKEAVKKIFLAVPTLIKYIHFNTEHPENHNISIKNMRSGIAKVYNGKEWELMDEKDVIRSLINDYESTLENYAEDKAPKYIEKSLRKVSEKSQKVLEIF
jgi:hypothetical protein